MISGLIFFVYSNAKMKFLSILGHNNMPLIVSLIVIIIMHNILCISNLFVSNNKKSCNFNCCNHFFRSFHVFILYSKLIRARVQKCLISTFKS